LDGFPTMPELRRLTGDDSHELTVFRNVLQSIHVPHVREDPELSVRRHDARFITPDIEQVRRAEGQRPSGNSLRYGQRNGGLARPDLAEENGSLEFALCPREPRPAEELVDR